MRILYACNFNLNKFSGKERATRQKLDALSLQVVSLRVISAGDTMFRRLFSIPINEFKCIKYLLLERPDVLVTRGFIGFIPQWVASKRKILTVREIHSDQVGEVAVLKKNILTKSIVYLFARYSAAIDRNADLRIFNHPTLKSWYSKIYGLGDFDIFCYNGFDPKSKVNISKRGARNKYGLKNDIIYLVFTGSASSWHGVDYLVDLQKEINVLTADIQIICAGGKIDDTLDPDKLLINISPLNDEGCSELLTAGDACLLPVKVNRVSPGSPLKLYDYIAHKKYIITQKDMMGYSDEVDKYGFGIAVDFESAKLTAQIILNINWAELSSSGFQINKFSWEARMSEWLDAIHIGRIQERSAIKTNR
jgi:glycosyltransferase involved in cell wall biosynthesis